MDSHCRQFGARFMIFFYCEICRMLNPSDWEKIVFHYSYQKIYEAEKDGYQLEVPTWPDPPPSDFERETKLYDLGLEVHDLQPYFERPHDLSEVFLDKGHLAHRGNKKVAEVIFAKMQLPNNYQPKLESLCLDVKKESIYYMMDEIQLRFINRKDVKEWLNAVQWRLPENASVGSIVMNCNPFTYGHKYLIEQALKKVDYLYVFAVQENRSAFSFKDRIKLMKQGTKNCKGRVKIVPSGNFIISSLTFPGYFAKEVQKIDVDSSFDILIFGAVIAHVLKIKHRFVGEEPYCQVTSDYNLNMLKYLPEMDIQVHVIPRFASSGEAISASQVRELLEQKRMHRVYKIVPPSTYRYLRKRLNKEKSFLMRQLSKLEDLLFRWLYRAHHKKMDNLIKMD